MIIGLLPPEAGEIRWQGAIHPRHSDDFRADLCYLCHLNAIKEELDLLENLLAAVPSGRRNICRKTTPSMRWSRSAGLARGSGLQIPLAGQKRRVALFCLVHERRALGSTSLSSALDAAAVDWLPASSSAHLQRGGLAGHDHAPAGRHSGRHFARELKLAEAAMLENHLRRDRPRPETGYASP